MKKRKIRILEHWLCLFRFCRITCLQELSHFARKTRPNRITQRSARRSWWMPIVSRQIRARSSVVLTNKIASWSQADHPRMRAFS